MPSRHLVLIPVAEHGGNARTGSVDLETVVRLARTGDELPDPIHFDAERLLVSAPAPRITVAGGAVFTFGCAEHPELLAAAGAEVVTFEPAAGRRALRAGT